MGISVNWSANTGSINTNYRINDAGHNVRFTSSNLTSDRFETNSPDKYITEYALNKAINENTKIQSILNEANIPAVLNMKELREIQSHHASDTKRIAAGIIDNLPFSLKNKADKYAVEQAAYLHDIGKVLIPSEILNKNSKLTAEETEIMHKHSELGYELLKNSGLDKKTLSLIKNHHQNAQKTGYPFVDNTFFADINQQIVSLADKYSALTEKRSYKKPMTSKEALTVILKDVNEGKYNPLIFNSLVKYSQQTDNISYIKA